MRKFIWAFLFILHLNKLFSQVDPRPYKEHYDDLISFYYHSGSEVNDGLSWTMKSLINMYKTTKDKAYLIKFINISILAQKNRFDELHPGDPSYPPKWTLTCTGECESIYQNGLILFPMAEFVYLVYNDNALYNTNLPLGIISDDLPSSPVIIGYGDYANWLGKKIEETLSYINAHYWDPILGLVKNQNSDKIGGINWQSHYASTLLYMALIPNPSGFGFGDNRPIYLSMARQIAALYKGTVTINDECRDIHYNNSVLIPHSNNSYYWYLRTWGVTQHHDCFAPDLTYHFDTDDWNYFAEYLEDVSHGAMSMVFPRICYEHNLTPSGSTINYFGNNEMLKFRNTFAYNIFDYSNNVFHNNVYGTDGAITDNPGTDPNQFATAAILNWMPFQKFDNGESDANHKVYNIIKKQWDCLMDNRHADAILPPGFASTTNLKYISSYQGYLGLSEIVQAQWENECVDLLLKKRKLIYDQDFIVKNRITINPTIDNELHPLNLRPFAEPNSTVVGSPSYFVNNEFLVEPGITSNMIAGEEIVFKPGFNAKAGCNFTASINENDCSDGRNMSAMNGFQNNDAEVIALLDKQIISWQESKTTPINTIMDVYPNPNTGTFQVSLSYDNIPSLIKLAKVYDILGKEIWSSESNSSVLNIDISSYSTGMYYVHAVNLKGESISKLIIKE